LLKEVKVDSPTLAGVVDVSLEHPEGRWIELAECVVEHHTWCLVKEGK
jgi:hypothetical protein